MSEPMKKTNSVISIGFPEVASDEPKKNSPKPPDRSKSTERDESVEDICCLLVFCDKHQKICVQLPTNKVMSYWIPTALLNPKNSWTQTASALLELILKGRKSVENLMTKKLQLVNVFRVHLPENLTHFVLRITYLVRLCNKETTEERCCENTAQYQWIHIKEVLHNSSIHFCGPEVQTLVRALIERQNNVLFKRLEEMDETDALKDFIERPAICQTKEQQVIRSARFKRNDIISLYKRFVQHCSPSQFMTLKSFESFSKRSGFKIIETNLKSTFRAFDCNKRSYLTFNDLLLGLAAMDWATEHGGDSGAVRCAYLLRFYDSDSDGFLTHSNICQIIVDIQNNYNNPNSNQVIGVNTPSVTAKANELIKNNGSNGRMSLHELTQAIGSLQLRGTSTLFRLNAKFKQSSKQSFLETKSNYPSVRMTQFNNYDIVCQNCRKRTFKLSKHIYHMSKNGEVFNFTSLNPNPKVQFMSHISDPAVHSLALEIINKINNMHTAGLARKDLTTVSAVEQKQIDNWYFPSKEELIQKLKTLCAKSQTLVESEDRVLQVSTPCYILGDIHGNFKDLMVFSENIWRSSPFISEANYLFLGDYVDRGQYGVECVAYLLALKLLAPKRFWFCRGNHEIRSLQEMFTFQSECVDRYSVEVWDAFNEVFDRLPIAAVVDHKLFCSHGGIPTTTNSIEVLRSVPTYLPDPEQQAQEVWEVLWNDPMSAQDFQQLSDFQRIQIQDLKGFLPNMKRNTGFYYSEQAVNQFLQHNKMQFVIRGHECVEKGYQFLINGKVITIFSTSLYCGNLNIASILFVNYNKIRVIRVHTFDL